ncbi:MAG: S8 family serine peptidase [Oscillospiraceae bacterium]|nr:S8 family serine peptidase [Oscillospiraceae bacterium]
MGEIMFGKKFLALALVFAVGLSAFVGVGIPKASGDTFDIMAYYAAATDMVYSNWRDDYFAEAVISVSDNTLTLDNRTIMLQNEVETEHGDLMLTEEILEALGETVQKAAEGITAPRTDRAALPASLLEEQAGFEVRFDSVSCTFTISNDFQSMRILAQTVSGKLPKDLGASEVLAGPDNTFMLQFDTIDEAVAANEKLNNAANIAYAEPDTLVIADQSVSQSHLSWGANRIGAGKYMDYLIANGRQNAKVVVAVLDTGLDPSHSIFKGREVPGSNFIDNIPGTMDSHGHGTHVSGTVVDVTLSLPNVKIMPVKVLNNEGKGMASSTANAVRWAADNGADVINMSLGGAANSTADNAVTYAKDKGVTVIVAAGNEAVDAKFTSPARSPHAVTVAAVNSINRPANFSNFGDVVDISAPGVSIVSAFLGGKTASASGTSMASPHVAGAAALLLATNPSLSPDEVKSLLCDSVDKWLTDSDKRYGTGILNIGASAGKIPFENLPEITTPPVTTTTTIITTPIVTTTPTFTTTPATTNAPIITTTPTTTTAPASTTVSMPPSRPMPNTTTTAESVTTPPARPTGVPSRPTIAPAPTSAPTATSTPKPVSETTRGR